MTICSIPEHLQQFRCMKPWIGAQYSRHRVLVVGESHYLPPGSWRNLKPLLWYTGSESDLTDLECSYIHTSACVRFRLSDEGRTLLPNNIYVRIGGVVPFERIAFFNYFFRPGKFKQSVRTSFRLEHKDRTVSTEILEWFIGEHQPRLIIVASSLAGRYAGAVLNYSDLPSCITHHPMAPGSNFRYTATAFLATSGYPSQPVDSDEAGASPEVSSF